MTRKDSISKNRKILEDLLDADKQARKTVEKARVKAEKIVEEAKKKADSVMEKAKKEARDESEKILDGASRNDSSQKPGSSSSSDRVYFSEEEFSGLAEENMEDAVNFLVGHVTGKN